MMKKFGFILFLFCIAWTMKAFSTKPPSVKLNTGLSAGSHIYIDTTPLQKSKNQIQILQPDQKPKSKKLITGKVPLVALAEDLNSNDRVVIKHNPDLYTLLLRRQQQSKVLIS